MWSTNFWTSISIYWDVKLDTWSSLNVDMRLAWTSTWKTLEVLSQYQKTIILDTDTRLTQPLYYNWMINIWARKLYLQDGSFVWFISSWTWWQLLSNTSPTGDNEVLRVWSILGSVTTNFWNLELYSWLNSWLVWRNIKIMWPITLNQNIALSWSLEITKSWSITNTMWSYTFSVLWNFVNRGTYNSLGALYIYWDIDTISWSTIAPTYIQWNQIEDYINYSLNITWENDVLLNWVTNYLLPFNVLTWTDKYWKVKWIWSGTWESDYTTPKCINVPWCIY